MRTNTEKASKNIFFNLIAQLFNVCLVFVIRTIFVRQLGTAYLGLNGVLSNLLSLLSMAELGVGNAMIYSLYEPLVKKDYTHIASLLKFYKNIYYGIAAIVMILGVVFCPFIDYFIVLEHPIKYLHLYYLMFLMQIVLSYLLVYKTSLLLATQQEYVISRNSLYVNITIAVFQIFVLIKLQSYLLYLVLQLIAVVMTNLINSYWASKEYKFIEVDSKGIAKEEKKDIWQNIASMFSYKIGGVVLNNTDSLIISRIVGTIVVGYYSNYMLIVNKVSYFISIIFNALQAAVGNHNVKSTAENKYELFNVLSLIEFWIYANCVLVFVLGFNDFIVLWLGQDYCLDASVVYVSAFNFYLQGVLYPIFCYRNTTGLFKQTKHIMLVAAVLNIFLSVFLGLRYGLYGILLATGISRMFTNIWYEPLVLFRDYFKASVVKYYIKELLRVVELIIIIVSFNILFGMINVNSVLGQLLIKCFVGTVGLNIILLLQFRKSKEFIFLIQKIKLLIRGEKSNL